MKRFADYIDLLEDPPDRNHPSNTSNGLFLETIRHSKYATRDQRRDIKLLYDEGHTIAQIAQKQDLTERQVHYALHHPATPQKRKGRPQKVTPEEPEHLINWICSSKTNRRCRWDDIPWAAGLPHLGVYAVRYVLRKAGFRRYAARRKPPISEQNRLKRLQFAYDHINWTQEQWDKILWSDEAWVTARRHTKTWFTRRQDEECDPTCIVERVQRPKGWMFWGCFNASRKGPGIFWEKH